MQNYIGQQIDRYRITERLGMGGMAVVYKAYDTRLERDVALKLIRTESIPQDQHDRLFKRFEREAKAQARFSHRNIIAVHDYGEVDGSPYLVMALVPGGTLKDRLHGPVDWRQAVRWLIPVAEALSYAHQRGIVHRDVKPANILFDEEDQPILTDFGIAKILETDEATLTGTGLGVGTPEYMAPEQWQGKTSEATDQYALGVVLYELITGRKPYAADTPAAIILMQATEPLASPSKIVGGIPESVEKALYKALSRNPEDRYEDMGAFAKALRGLLAEAETAEPILPQPKEREPQPPPVVQTRHENESATRDTLDPTPVEAMNAAQEATLEKRGLPAWTLWAGIGIVLVVLLGVAIGMGENLADKVNGDEEARSMLTSGTVTVLLPSTQTQTTFSAQTTSITLTPQQSLGNKLPIETNPPILSPEISQTQISEDILFSEDFEDGMAQKVKGVYGNWEIISDEINGKVYDIDNSKGLAFPGMDFGELFWSDYKVDLKVRFLEAKDKWAIIEFRRSGNADNKYIVSFDNDSVSLHYTTKGTDWQSITWKDYKVKQDVWYHLEIETKGTLITIKVDDDVVIQTEDSRFIRGSINIQAGPGTHAQFDDIQVISLE